MWQHGTQCKCQYLLYRKFSLLCLYGFLTTKCAKHNTLFQCCTFSRLYQCCTNVYLYVNDFIYLNPCCGLTDIKVNCFTVSLCFIGACKNTTSNSRIVQLKLSKHKHFHFSDFPYLPGCDSLCYGSSSGRLCVICPNNSSQAERKCILKWTCQNIFDILYKNQKTFIFLSGHLSKQPN